MKIREKAVFLDITFKKGCRIERVTIGASFVQLILILVWALL